MLLIIVLVLIGSIAVSVLSISKDSYVLDEYVQRTIEYENIYLVSDAITKALKDIFKNDTQNFDYLGEFWSERLTVPIENGEIKLVIVDQERFLNPNFLVDRADRINNKYLNIFLRLFDLLNINQQILFNIVDWIDKNNTSNGGIEFYQDYQAKNSKLDTLEELKLIEGIDETIFNGRVENGEFVPGFKSVLSVYSNGKVNINTASKWVLMALDNDIDETLASSIIAYRNTKPFKNINDLIFVEGMNSDILHRISPIIDVKSQNFIAYVDIILGDRKYKMQILIERQGRNIKEKWRRVF